MICDELAALLRAWWDSTTDDDIGKNGLVFPTAPHKRSWADDRARAGLERNDSRGRPLSAHSARKWFKTELVRAGVHGDLIDRLMRHRTGVGQRYYDPTPQEQAEALDRLPKNLWPEIVDPQRFTTLSPKSAGFGIDTAASGRPNEVVTPVHTPTRQIKNPRPPAGRTGVTSCEPAGTGLPALSGLNGADPVSGDRPRNGDFRPHSRGSDSGEAAGDNPATDRRANSSTRPVGERAPGERPGLPIHTTSDMHARAELAAVEALAAFVRRGAVSRNSEDRGHGLTD